MMKKIMKIVLLFFVLIGYINFSYSQANNKKEILLLEKALDNYKKGNVEEAKKQLELFLSKLNNEKELKKIETSDIVEFNKIKNFPSRYLGKKLKLNNIVLSSNVGEKINECFSIRVTTANRSSTIHDWALKEGSIIFVISEKLLEKLIENLNSRNEAYFNLYTDKIYKWEKEVPYMPSETYYVAKIIRLEKIEYNWLTNESKSTGIFLSE